MDNDATNAPIYISGNVHVLMGTDGQYHATEPRFGDSMFDNLEQEIAWFQSEVIKLLDSDSRVLSAMLRKLDSLNAIQHQIAVCAQEGTDTISQKTG